MAMDTYIYTYQPRFSRELVYAKSSTSRWIASRSRKLSDRSGAAGCCVSAPSGCGCLARRHSGQSVLPAARATALEQPSSWHRLPPPCAWQWSVPPPAAAFEQPSCWHRLPPPCATQ
jgi:glucose/arabinose dehydrogenase